MKSALTNLNDLQQKAIVIKIDYYDDAEKVELSKYPSSERIRDVISKDLEIPVTEFLTYYLFHKKRPGKIGWRDYQDISKNISKAISELEDFIVFNGKSISIPKDVGNQVPQITQYIGESIGLSVINRIHNLTEADWDKIPEYRGKGAFPTFDYETTASDGKNIVQVETKGSSIENNENKTGTIKSQKSKIKEKKEKIQNREKEGNYPHSADIKYGTITAVDFRQDGNVMCWLLDPPFENDIAPNPLKSKIINRVQFIRDWIYFISPRSQLSSALSTRLRALIAIEDIYQLNNVPLVRGNDEPFGAIQPKYFGMNAGWFTNKSHVTDGSHVGVVLQLSPNRLIFLGIREELLELAAEQNFERIIKYQAETGRIHKKIECIISQSRFRKFELPPYFLEKVNDQGNYIHFILEGILNFTSGGLVWGLLPIPEEGTVKSSVDNIPSL